MGKQYCINVQTQPLLWGQKGQNEEVSSQIKSVICYITVQLQEIVELH